MSRAKFKQTDVSDFLIGESVNIAAEDQQEITVIVRCDNAGIYRVAICNGTTEDGIAALNIGNHILMNALMPEGNF